MNAQTFDNLHNLAWCDERTLAKSLAKLDAKMRRTNYGEKAVKTRLQFFVASVFAGVVNHLNAIGEKVPSSALSERSLDRVFEDGTISDEVVVRLVALYDTDSAFRSELDRQGFALSVKDWRDFAKTLPAQATLFR